MLPRDLPASRVLDFARRADELGFAELWVVEDLGFRGGFAQAAAVLAATSSIRVGIGILPAAVRNVAFTAMEINTLAELFGDRIDVGVGHGAKDWMKQIGVWPPSPLAVLREQFSTLRTLLAGGETADGVRLTSPASRPPRLLAGVRGPRSLALAGEVADGTILAEPATPEYVAAARERIGDVPGHHVVAYNVASVHPDHATAVRTVRPALEWIGEPDWAPHLAPLPFAAEFAALRASCATRAEFTERLPEEWVTQLALAGTPDAVRARIQAIADAGASTVVLVPAGNDGGVLDDFAAVL
ncbi:LLM class flavin-dependent oxidoreductase [Amycolatopsis suaedae]|uniref:LLM class flavin-dependent oxidoreductase n=2 Tax=Amycolatopsis suaedae TaxID=2510978 RepID=A0A4Q7J5N2_9PSEU|nr:LLM class flavin-dependent oxidoreductase [Amycolatopsis suaedae]